MITTLVTGRLATNTYFVSDSSQAVVIDPGDDAEYLAAQLAAGGLTPAAVFLTHGHFDHMLAAMELSVAFGIKVHLDRRDWFLSARMSETAAYFLGRKIVEKPPRVSPYPGSGKVAVGSLKGRIIRIPGHTPGSVAIFFPELTGVFTGDLLFENGGTGRTDFSYSSRRDLWESIVRIFKLPAGTAIYPGHGPSTTVAREKICHGVQ